MTELGISSIIFERKMGLFDGLKLIRQHGFSCVDLSICDYSLPSTPEEESFRGDGWESVIERLQRHLEAIGLRCNQAHGTWGQTTDLSDFCPPDAMQYRQIEIARRLGADTLVFHPVLPSKRVETGEERQRYIDYTVEWFKYLAEFAASRSAGIAIENVFADRGNEPHEGLYPFGDAASLNEIVDRVGYAGLGVCLDTGHAHLHVGRRLGDMIDSLGHRIRCLHLNDNMGRKANVGASDLHLVPVGDGIDLAEVAEHLQAIGYDGALSLEVVDRTPNETVLREYLRHAYESSVAFSAYFS